MIIQFDPKESDPRRVKDSALRFIKRIKENNMGFDIELWGLLHLFIKACGVTQDELDLIYGRKNN
jgi:hypothetical protein